MIRPGVSWLLVVGCAREPLMEAAAPRQDEQALAGEALPPPWTLHLSAPIWWLKGSPTPVLVNGAGGGRPVALAASLIPAGVQACVAPVGCLELHEIAFRLAQTSAGPGGTARFALNIPRGAPSGVIDVQALSPSGAGLQRSADIRAYLMSPTEDEEYDGLSNEFEINTFGSNPTLVDTDGGGLSDDQEFAGGSDPNDPLDDGGPWAHCEIPFDNHYGAIGEGGDPGSTYINYGLLFQGTSGYGITGGDLHGDPGGFSDVGQVPNPAWAVSDQGFERGHILWSRPVANVEFTLIRAAGTAQAEARVRAFAGGVVMEEFYVSLSTGSSRHRVQLVVHPDMVEIELVDGFSQMWLVDNVAYDTSLACPP